MRDWIDARNHQSSEIANMDIRLAVRPHAAPRRLSALGAALGVWLLAIGCSQFAEGAVICGSALRGKFIARSSYSAPRGQLPLARDRQQDLQLLIATSDAAGAGSSSQTHATNASVLAVVGERLTTIDGNVVSRLALSSRVALPDPLKDRFFRPPRTSVV